jgi:hypothetical protein
MDAEEYKQDFEKGKSKSKRVGCNFDVSCFHSVVVVFSKCTQVFLEREEDVH